MPRKVVIVADPGIDTAFAVALAMADPALDVVGLLPCAGNVSAARASSNVQIIVSQVDPPKWPRTASALPVEYDIDGTALHGPDGLGGVNFPITDRHQQTPADKALVELVREDPHHVTVVCLGPTTTIARALDREPELPALLGGLVLVGGTWHEPGNAGPVSEFHFALDPISARRCLMAGLHPTVLPLDVTRRLVLSPSELLELPNPESRTSQFLRQIVPYGIRASSQLYGIEGFHLKDVVGVAAVALPGVVTTAERAVDIELKGERTRGMMVVDARKGGHPAAATAMLGEDAAVGELRQYIDRILRQAP